MFPILNDNVIYRRLDSNGGKTYELIFPANGKKVTLNDDSDNILTLCTGANSIADVISSLAAQYIDDKQLLEKQVNNVINIMVEHGFLRVDKAKPDNIRQAPGIVDISYPLNVLSIEVTGRCNLNCRHCYAESSPRQEAELADDVILAMLDEFSALSGISVAFTGGEPLLKNSIFDLIAHAAKKRLAVKILSNGTLITKDVAQRLYDSGLRTVQISLDGHTPEIHDEYRGSSGAFEKTVKSISLLRDLGLEVDVVTVVNKTNLPHLEKIVDLCAQWDIVPLFNKQQQTGRALKEATHHALHYQEYTAAMHLIDEYLSEATGKSRFQYPVRTQTRRCSAGINALTVKVNGDVFPCIEFKDPCFVIGNVLKSSLADIWNNNGGFIKTLREHRTDHIRICNSCGNNTFCNGGCPAMAFDVWGDICWPDIDKCATVHYRKEMNVLIETNSNDDNTVKYCG